MASRRRPPTAPPPALDDALFARLEKLASDVHDASVETGRIRTTRVARILMALTRAVACPEDGLLLEFDRLAFDSIVDQHGAVWGSGAPGLRRAGRPPVAAQSLLDAVEAAARRDPARLDAEARRFTETRPDHDPLAPATYDRFDLLADPLVLAVHNAFPELCPMSDVTLPRAYINRLAADLRTRYAASGGSTSVTNPLATEDRVAIATLALRACGMSARDADRVFQYLRQRDHRAERPRAASSPPAGSTTATAARRRSPRRA